jgi:uncharacterized protein (PEP-CTERM system associated)
MGAPMLPMAAPVALLAMLLAPQARAEIKVVPAVDLRATYTDNVTLTDDNNKHGQFITELTPSLSLDSNTPRLKLRATLASHLYAYLGERVDGTNSSSRELSADARATLVDELLFFDGGASIGQQSTSAFGQQVNQNGYSNTNRNEVRTWRASPYLRHRFGSFAEAQLRYTRDSVQSGNLGFASSKGDSVAMTVSSGPTFRTIGWGAMYNRQDVDDSLGRKSRAESAEVSLRWRMTNEFSLKGAGGYDKYDFGEVGGQSSGASRAVGFIWTPSLRTSVDASIGKRYFGNSYALTALHRSRNTVWNINYSDGITTSRAEFLGIAQISTASLLDRLFVASYPDPVQRRQAVDAYIRATGLPLTLPDKVNTFTNRFLLQRQMQAAVALNGSRTTAVFSLNAVERRAVSNQQSDGALLGSVLLGLNDDIRQVSASFATNYRISPRSAVNLVVNKARTRSLSNGLEGDQTLLSASVTRQFMRNIKGAVELRHAQGTAGITGGQQYRENAISASLSYQL